MDQIDERLLSARTIKNEDESETSLRPHKLSDYVGQEKVKEFIGFY